MSVAIFLIMVAVLNMLPMEVFAKDVKKQNNVKTVTNDTVIVEDEQRREANVKHFQLSDGTYEAVVYTEAVHRRDKNGQWQDIDNRLYSKGAKEYISSDERIVFYKSLNQSEQDIFSLSENGYSISVKYNENKIKNSDAILFNHEEKYVSNKKDSKEVQYSKLKEVDNTTTIEYRDIQKMSHYSMN